MILSNSNVFLKKRSTQGAAFCSLGNKPEAKFLFYRRYKFPRKHRQKSAHEAPLTPRICGFCKRKNLFALCRRRLNSLKRDEKD